MLNKRSSRNYHRWLGGGRKERVELLKRDDDLRQQVVVSHLLFQCRWSANSVRTGEMLHREMQVGSRRTIHVPLTEMKRVGVNYINPADRFVDLEGRFWMPDAETTITEKQYGTHFDVDCTRVDPPNNLTRV